MLYNVFQSLRWTKSIRTDSIIIWLGIQKSSSRKLKIEKAVQTEINQQPKSSNKASFLLW